MNKLALEGVRITDFSQVWAGPYITLLLGFMGAEIIKIESMKRLDQSRTYSLTLRRVFEGVEQSPLFNDLNLNKLSIRLDLTHPKAVELAKRIVKVSDIVVQNFRPGVMERLGLGYEALREVKPDIIYLSSSARGMQGPERHYVGYAPCFAALGGQAHITGYADGPPFAMRGRIDLLSATTSAFAILAALNYRRRTGEGQHIDLSSSETTSVLIGDVIMDYTMNRRSQTRRGNRDEIMAPHNCYRCKGDDKWVSIAISTEEEWKSFCHAIGNPEWTKEERFSDAYSRWNNQEELDRLVTEWTASRTHYEVMEILQKAGVAAIPSFNAEEIFNNPHLRERNFASEVDHPVIGKQVVINPPWKLSATPATVRRHGPLLGEHNQYVFSELLGISEQEIASLVEEKAIY